jgi:hypothetical protein
LIWPLDGNGFLLRAADAQHALRLDGTAGQRSACGMAKTRAAQAIEYFAAQGVAVKEISEDSPLTVPLLPLSSGIFEDRDLVGPEDGALQGMARSMRQNGTRSRRARAASQPGSQHVDLAAWRGRVEAVLDQRNVSAHGRTR